MAPEQEVALSDYEKGKPAPATLYGVMGEDGAEREVSTKQPERGHVLVQKGENVEQHHLDRIAGHTAFKASQAPAPAEEPDTTADNVNASDAAAALAKANDIDIATVEGTGADGKVTKADVEKAIKAKSV